MRKMFLLLSLLLAGTIAGSAKDYSHYYTNLPVEVAPVTEVTFPDRHASLTDFGAKGDGVTLCTEAFARGIESLSAQGEEYSRYLPVYGSPAP